MSYNEDLPRLLRAMASGAHHKAAGTDQVLLAAAEELEADWLPLEASAVRITRCSNPDCRLAHITLLDEADQPLATAVLNAAAMDEVNEWCRTLRGDA